MKQKILYVITKSNWGGAQRYVYDLATNLPKDQFNVSVVLGGNGILKEKLETAGVRTITLSALQRDIHIFKEFFTFFSLFQIVLKEKPDILHANSSKAGGFGVFVGRMCGVPRIIFTAHGWAFNEDRPWWQKGPMHLFYWLTILLSHATIAVSFETKRQMSNFPFVTKKMTVVHSGINEQVFRTRNDARNVLGSKSTTLKKFSQNEKVIYLGSIAELHKTKGLEYAIETMTTLKKAGIDCIYIIIGEGEYRAYLELLIQKYKLEDCVFLLGFMNNAAQYLLAFDILLAPSISEALSYTLLEAGRARLPVIATNVGGIPEIIEHEKCGLLVPPRDTPAIANALIKLLSNGTARHTYGEAFFETIQKNFSCKEMLGKTIDLYK